MKEKAAFGRPPSFPTREASVVGHLRDVGDGTFGGAMGVQRCLGSGGGASWGAGGSASSLEGRQWRLPTCGRPHWSRAFNNAGDGTGASRGGGSAKRCDATTSWREQRGGVEDGCVRRLPDEMSCKAEARDNRRCDNSRQTRGKREEAPVDKMQRGLNRPRLLV